MEYDIYFKEWNYIIHFGQTLEQAAQRGGWVTIPGSVQKACRCGTLAYGLVGMVVLGGWLDFMILEVFSNLWFYDSVLYCLCCIIIIYVYISYEDALGLIMH